MLASPVSSIDLAVAGGQKIVVLRVLWRWEGGGLAVERSRSFFGMIHRL
jgi:hypothetical protein